MQKPDGSFRLAPKLSLEDIRNILPWDWSAEPHQRFLDDLRKAGLKISNGVVALTFEQSLLRNRARDKSWLVPREQLDDLRNASCRPGADLTADSAARYPKLSYHFAGPKQGSDIAYNTPE